MTEADSISILGPAIAGALERKGYTSLTPVQEAVLDPEVGVRDLRITSQTGSGKTVAVGFAIRDLVENPPKRPAGPTPSKPRVIVVTPTRELAKQVETELGWLFAATQTRVVSVIGGASYRDELRALSVYPAIVVGTPGRLLDHLERRSIDASELGAIVLDEADRMLDMGFKDELDAIMAKTPENRRTHLMSATFPRDVRALADRVQRNPFFVQGTPLGAANADIDHILYLVDPRDRLSAIVNLMLASGNDQTLIFARTRADVGELAQELGRAGFVVMMLSGEMEQRDRERALRAFKTGQIRALVATDVAARGIDVQDIARVIHAEPPTDADTYTHRAGRTGRAGKKGTSAVLVAPSSRNRAMELLRRAGVHGRVERLPTAESIRASRDAALIAELQADDPEAGGNYEPRLWSLAEKLATGDQVVRTITRLLQRGRFGGTTDPREIRSIDLPVDRAPRTLPPAALKGDRPQRGKLGETHAGFTPFKVTWGSTHGADVRRLLALVCRRGDIRGNDIGAIQVGRAFSVVEVRSEHADRFEANAAAPDPRDPRVKITRDGAAEGPAPQAAPPPKPMSPTPAPVVAAPAVTAPAVAAPVVVAPVVEAPVVVEAPSAPEPIDAPPVVAPPPPPPPSRRAAPKEKEAAPARTEDRRPPLRAGFDRRPAAPRGDFDRRPPAPRGDFDRRPPAPRTEGDRRPPPRADFDRRAPRAPFDRRPPAPRADAERRPPPRAHADRPATPVPADRPTRRERPVVHESAPAREKPKKKDRSVGDKPPKRPR